MIFNFYLLHDICDDYSTCSYNCFISNEMTNNTHEIYVNTAWIKR